jgi:BirA family biotin operon repressor/biotin-[acetyl-CoA-carboxylase] ligase
VATALEWPPESWPRLTLVAGLVAATRVGASLDWPNDLVVGQDKVGGLLTEVADGVAVFGLGVNLWWPDAPAGMAAIYPSDPGEEAAHDIGAAFASGLIERIAAGPADWGRREYLELCVTIGESVVWEGGSGTAVDVAADGALVVETATHAVHLHSSEVERIRRSTVPPMRPQ